MQNPCLYRGSPRTREERKLRSGVKILENASSNEADERPEGKGRPLPSGQPTANPLRFPRPIWILAILAMALPIPLAGQIPDSVRIPPDSALVDVEEAPVPVVVLDEASRGITPRGAFIRSGFVPGWGHAKVGAYGRGAFYFLVEAVSGFMAVKTHGQLALAKDRRVFWESVMTDRIQAVEGFDLETIAGLDALEEALAEDPHVEDLRGLENARSEQLEDWVALGVFFLFLGGADAYVSAHLADFPGAVEVNTNPSGGVEVGLSLPVGF